MERKTIENSSQISSIGYDEEKKVMEVTYKSNGSTYQYMNVNKELWEQAQVAESVGKFVNGYIKKSHDFKLIS